MYYGYNCAHDRHAEDVGMTPAELTEALAKQDHMNNQESWEEIKTGLLSLGGMLCHCFNSVTRISSITNRFRAARDDLPREELLSDLQPSQNSPSVTR